MRNMVIGSGFAGMAAGIKLNCPIYEMTNKAGGICQDYVKDGFTFSNGGPHWLFGKDIGLEYIKTLVEVKEYERNAGVYYNHTFPYPFQQEMQKSPEILGNSFKNDLWNRFGTEQCNMFFFPFNEKYTAGMMDKILPQDAYKSPTKGNGWVSTFCDPVGGLSTLVGKMASQCDIKYNKEAVSIDTENKIVRFKGDWKDLHNVEKYDRLISTIPLPHLMRLCGQEVDLPYTSVLVINIGAEPDINFPKEHWLYIPFCKSGFHRVAFYTNVDKLKAPEGKIGLSVEVAFKDMHTSHWFQEKALEIIEELKSWKWIKDNYETVWSIDIVPCAYTWEYNREDVPNAIQWLKERDIISTGRYGKHKFQGLTQSIEDGFNVD